MTILSSSSDMRICRQRLGPSLACPLQHLWSTGHVADMQQDAWKVSIYSLCCPSTLIVAHHSSDVQLNLIQENFR